LAEGQASFSDRQAVGRRQPKDLFVEGRCQAAPFKADQGLCKAQLVESHRHVGGKGGRPRRRAAGKNPTLAMAIEELPHPHLVACGKDDPAPRIPEREGEIPQKMACAVLAPSLPGAQDQRAIPDHASRRGEAELLQKLRTVVEPDIAGHETAGSGIGKRHGLEGRLGRGGEMPVTECNRPGEHEVLPLGPAAAISASIGARSVADAGRPSR
jgi:hypothetical protein